ncbi:MAG: hypothetical protein M3Z37_06865 [Candidatus Eremiobacteraeota bacterium]|nr:hypothetical protein [Candidatus Eremiobacteraeota bacterium]
MSARRVLLARLCDPLPTHGLKRCSESVKCHAVARLSARFMHRRHQACGERVLSALRRLRDPRLAAYDLGERILVSEPFGALPAVVRPALESIAQTFIREMLSRTPSAQLVAALRPFGEGALRAARDGGVRIRVLPASRKFAQCSPDVAAIVPDIDDWSAPPAGLFVLSERLLLLRSRALRMTAAHEFGHALDAIMASRRASYFSYESAEVRAAFAGSAGFVNEYAATGLDEYFAEALRAYTEVNDERSCWPPLTRYDLFVRDPRLFALVESFLRRVNEQGQQDEPIHGVADPTQDARPARDEQQAVR